MGWAGALFALALAGACKKVPEPASHASAEASGQALPAEPAAPAPHPPHAPHDAMHSGASLHLTWQDPPGFRRVPPRSPMRKASYEVPKASGDTEDGELAVFYFGPGEGGSLEDNVQRWVGQFSNLPAGAVKRADRQVNGLRAHTVEIERGTFASGMPGGATSARDGYGLIGAIVVAPTGNYFFKLTGPSKTVHAARSAFYSMLNSVRPSD